MRFVHKYLLFLLKLCLIICLSSCGGGENRVPLSFKGKQFVKHQTQYTIIPKYWHAEEKYVLFEISMTTTQNPSALTQNWQQSSFVELADQTPVEPTYWVLTEQDKYMVKGALKVPFTSQPKTFTFIGFVPDEFQLVWGEN